MEKNGSRALPVILFVIFIDLVCNGILVPIVPQLLANPESAFYLLPASVPASFSYIVLGILISLFPIFMFFAAPVLGEYSDYVGRRKVLLITTLGTAFALSIFATGVLIKSLAVIFIARIVGGMMAGNSAVAQATIADFTPPHKRAATFGLMGAAYGFGFIIGPVIGGVLSDPSIVPWFSASTPFWFAAILSLINFFAIFIFLKETRKFTVPASLNWHKAVHNIIKAFSMKAVRFVFATNFLFQAGLALFATFFAVFLTQIYGFSQSDVGFYIAYAGIWIIISQGFLVRILIKRYDEITLLRVFLIAGAVSIFFYHFADKTIGLLIVGALFALFNGVAMAMLPALASRRTSAEHQGEVLGLNSSVQALAQTAPPILAGIIAANISPAAPIYIAGAVIAGAWLTFIFGVKRTKEETN